jgi:hypothetical protein
MVSMSSSMRGGTKLQKRAIVVVANSSNGRGEVIRARCYCDRAPLAVTKHSNRRADGIGPLLL